MTRYLASLALLIALANAVVSAGQPAASPLAEPRKSVFLLHMELGEGMWASCTTFVVKDVFVTAAHCLADDPRIYIQNVTGQRWLATIVHFDPIRDIAILQSPFHAPALEIGQDPAEDDEVWSLNAVGGNVVWSLRGRVAGWDRQWFGVQLTGTGPGGSGSPVLCGNRVCGIMLGGFAVGELGRVLPVSAWKEILEAH